MMNRDKAKKMAEEYLGPKPTTDDPNRWTDYYRSFDAFMACYDAMTKGKPDGYIAHSERHGYDKTSFRAKESLVAELMIKGYPPGDSPLDMGWQIKPVKLIKVEAK